MVFETIKDYLRSIFQPGGGSSNIQQVSKNYITMTVWMPEFVSMVEENTRKMERIARRMTLLAKILEARNRLGR